MFSIPRVFRVCPVVASLLAAGFALAGATLSARFDGSMQSIPREQLRRMSLESRLTLDFLQQHHYRRMPLAAIEASDLLDAYMKDLDYSRLFFTELDRADIDLRFAASLKSVYLERGELYPAFAIFDLYRRRALERIDWVAQRLQQPFDFTTDLSYAPDRQDAAWPADTAEADALWERRLKFEVLQELLPDNPLDRAIEKIERRYTRTKRYVEEIEAHNVQEIFLTSLARLYDPHSNFFSVEAAEEFNIAISNSLFGIGAVLRDEDGYCTIQELMPGGPAEMSGQLYPGDRIIEVAQGDGEPVDVVDMKLRRVVQMIRGDKGTTVRLIVNPASSTDPSERKVVTLTRDEIKLTANLASARIFDLPMDEGVTVPIGVIELPSFYGSGDAEEGSTTSRDVEELLRRLKESGVQGIILDLRRNGGGLLTEAVRLAGLFIPKGPVVMVRNTGGQVETRWDTDGRYVYDGPLVVLVSRNSASASEIVAGALQSLNRAIVVGDRATHGKGTVQAPLDLARSMHGFFNRSERLGTVKVTIQKFYLPNGSSTQNEGVRADIPIPSVNELLKIGESDLPNAMAWDAITPAAWDLERASLPAGPVFDRELLEELRSRSERRREELEEFDYLRQQIEWFRERQERKEISLNLEQRRQQREEDEAFRNRMEAWLKDLKTTALPGREILLQVAAEKERQHQEKLLSTPLPNGRPKVNQYYQKVFYYQEPETGNIREVYVEYLDYEKGLKQIEDLVASLSEVSGVDLPAAKVEAILQQLKSGDRGSDFQVGRLFEEAFSSLVPGEAIEPMLTAFFLRMIAHNPEVLRTYPELDIPLRESLRVIADWLQIERSPFHPRFLAAVERGRIAAHEAGADQPVLRSEVEPVGKTRP